MGNVDDVGLEMTNQCRSRLRRAEPSALLESPPGTSAFPWGSRFSSLRPPETEGENSAHDSSSFGIALAARPPGP